MTQIQATQIGCLGRKFIFPLQQLTYLPNLSVKMFFLLERNCQRCFWHVIDEVIKVSKNCANFGRTRTAEPVRASAVRQLDHGQDRL
jgi:hypothetical protein